MIRFLAKRRFNYIDMLVTGAVLAAMRGESYWLALGLAVAGAVVSVIAEAKARAV